MIVYGKRPYTYILYDHQTETDYLRLAASDWYMRPRTNVDWTQVVFSAHKLEEEFIKLGLECGQS